MTAPPQAPPIAGPALPLPSGSTVLLPQHLHLRRRPRDLVRTVPAHPGGSLCCTEADDGHTHTPLSQVQRGLTSSLGACCGAALLRLPPSARCSPDLLRHVPAGWTEEQSRIQGNRSVFGRGFAEGGRMGGKNAVTTTPGNTWHLISQQLTLTGLNSFEKTIKQQTIKVAR